MNRKQFIESHGGECANWNWSWSFVNHESRFVIFGAWDTEEERDEQLILHDNWETNHAGRKQAGFTQSREHIRLVEEEGYSLKTFTMYYSNDKKDDNGNGPAKIADFEPVLNNKYLHRATDGWVALNYVSPSQIPEEVETPTKYFEGAVSVLSVNSYERNPIARQKCLDELGYRCIACDFDFEEAYGEVGKHYIHVHHIVPLHTIGKEYEINPIKDLVPLCANCHAIVHRQKPALTVEELKASLVQKN